MYYEFESLSEYLDTLQEGTINRNSFSRLSSETGSFSFTETNSYEEAVELCKYGYHQDFEKLIQLKSQLEKYIKLDQKKKQQFNNYVGYVPDVKAYLEGNPLSMIDQIRPKRQKVDIYLNASYASYTKKEQIYNRGAIVLSLIEILENKGYNVDFHLVEVDQEYSQVLYANWILKKENERLNLQKLYFPLCHPAWLRRLSFRLEEITPDISSAWSDGYGRPADVSLMREVIPIQENDIVLPQPSKIGIKGQDIVEDANTFFQYVEKHAKKDFAFQKIKK